MLMPEWIKFKAGYAKDARVVIEEVQCPDPRCTAAIVGGSPLRGYPTISSSANGQPEQVFHVGPTQATVLSGKLDALLTQ
jgi:hypothetical protein